MCHERQKSVVKVDMCHKRRIRAAEGEFICHQRQVYVVEGRCVTSSLPWKAVMCHKRWI